MPKTLIQNTNRPLTTYVAFVKEINEDVKVLATGGRAAEELLIARFGGQGYFIRVA